MAKGHDAEIRGHVAGFGHVNALRREAQRQLRGFEQFGRCGADFFGSVPGGSARPDDCSIRRRECHNGRKLLPGSGLAPILVQLADFRFGGLVFPAWQGCAP